MTDWSRRERRELASASKFLVAWLALALVTGSVFGAFLITVGVGLLLLHRRR